MHLGKLVSLCDFFSEYTLMKNTILYISFVLSFLVAFPTYSITPVLPENIYLHLDKSFYVTGEIIWYKLYLGTNLKDQPITIRATVANPEGKIVGDNFLKSEGRTGLDLSLIHI